MKSARLAIPAFLLGLSGCSSLPSGLFERSDAVVESPAAIEESAIVEAEVAPLPEPTPRERIDSAVQLLGAGKAAEARKELETVLIATPRDITALRLLEQLDADPRKLLGEKSERYVVQAGDTMSGLAARFVGDPLMFYALSRYNGLAAPNSLTVGRTLKVPVREKPASIPEPVPEIAHLPQVSPADAAQANAVRLRGLESLNTGDIADAVALLQKAHDLDQTDAAIQRDLDRALRIQAALQEG